MATVQKVFDQAIHLLDEQNESSGATVTSDTAEYKKRTISILNTIMPRLYPYSDTYDTASRGRPVCPVLDVPDYANPDFTQEVPLDNTLALGVLPYLLASHLVAGENEDLSVYFLTQYNQVFADVRSQIPASFESIPTPYGLF